MVWTAVVKGDKPAHLPPTVSEKCRNFIYSCMRKNPNERPNVHELLQHPFLNDTYSEPSLTSKPSIRKSTKPVTTLTNDIHENTMEERAGSEIKKYATEFRTKLPWNGDLKASKTTNQRIMIERPWISRGDYSDEFGTESTSRASINKLSRFNLGTSGSPTDIKLNRVKTEGYQPGSAYGIDESLFADNMQNLETPNPKEIELADLKRKFAHKQSNLFEKPKMPAPPLSARQRPKPTGMDTMSSDSHSGSQVELKLKTRGLQLQLRNQTSNSSRASGGAKLLLNLDMRVQNDSNNESQLSKFRSRGTALAQAHPSSDRRDDSDPHGHSEEGSSYEPNNSGNQTVFKSKVVLSLTQLKQSKRPPRPNMIPKRSQQEDIDLLHGTAPSKKQGFSEADLLDLENKTTATKLRGPKPPTFSYNHSSSMAVSNQQKAPLSNEVSGSTGLGPGNPLFDLVPTKWRTEQAENTETGSQVTILPAKRASHTSTSRESVPRHATPTGCEVSSCCSSAAAS